MTRIAFKPLCCGLVLNIMDIIPGPTEKLLIQYNNDVKMYKRKIYYNKKGNPFFNIDGWRYYIDEFMRV